MFPDSTMKIDGIGRRSLAGLAAGVAIVATTLCLGSAASAQDAKLRFAVGPFQPTPSDTRRAYEPFFKHLAEQLGAPYELVVTNDWAGISIALATEQADVAWMGPWGYVLAHNEGGAHAVATVKYQGRPTYHAIILGRPGLNIKKWPEDAKGLSISFADVGSTSGWLIPTHWFQKQGIDPKTFFKYRDGASHAANVIAVASGQVDLATDFDRNRNLMIARNAVPANATEVVWTSDPLPNDPIVVRKSFPPARMDKLRQVLLSITEEQALTLMPANYTGWVAATHKSYDVIEAAGIAIGRIKPQ
jgi:phosphonate transport system substrate-binding protein